MRTVDVAGLSFRIERPEALSPDEQSLVESLARRPLLHGGLRLPGSGPAWPVRHLDSARAVFPHGPIPAGTPGDAKVVPSREDVRVEHTTFSACVDFALGEVRLHRRVATAGPLEVALRIATGCRLGRRGALPLHAAGVVNGEGAIVFAGPSEAGKTTLCRTSPYTVLSDEVVAVVPGEGGTLVGATGSWATDRRERPADGFFPLRAFVRLRKGPSYALRALGTRESFLLLAEALTLPGTRELWTEALASAVRLAAAVPAFEMTWSREEPPWARLEEDLRERAAA